MKFIITKPQLISFITYLFKYNNIKINKQLNKYRVKFPYEYGNPREAVVLAFSNK